MTPKKSLHPRVTTLSDDLRELLDALNNVTEQVTLELDAIQRLDPNRPHDICDKCNRHRLWTQRRTEQLLAADRHLWKHRTRHYPKQTVLAKTPTSVIP
jgi:hypothetical protein